MTVFFLGMTVLEHNITECFPVNTLFVPNMTIWHKSARMGEILKPCHNFEILIALVFPEWSLCRGYLVVPGHKCRRQSKNVVHTNWPPGWPGISNPCWGYFRNIEFWGSFATHLHIINIYCTLFLSKNFDSPWFLLSETNPESCFG